MATFRTPVPSAIDSSSLPQLDISQESVNRAQSAMDTLLKTLLVQMVCISTKGDELVAKKTLGNMCTRIVECLRAIAPSRENTSLQNLIKNEVRSRFEFPCLLSCFNSVNIKTQDIIFKEIKLGADFPFIIPMNTQCLPIVLFALYIVTWISAQRHEPLSIYRRIVPEVGNKEFNSVHGGIWDEVIGFHLDYLMSPKPRIENIVAEKGQLLIGVDREAELRNWENYIGVKGPLTEFPKFKEILTKKNTRTLIRRATCTIK